MIDNIIDRNCTGCIRECDASRYNYCAANNYKFHKEVPEKPKYFSKIYTGFSDEIAEELNKDFRRNPEYRLIKLTQFSEKFCGDRPQLLAVFELI